MQKPNTSAGKTKEMNNCHAFAAFVTPISLTLCLQFFPLVKSYNDLPCVASFRVRVTAVRVRHKHHMRNTMAHWKRDSATSCVIRTFHHFTFRHKFVTSWKELKSPFKKRLHAGNGSQGGIDPVGGLVRESGAWEEAVGGRERKGWQRQSVGG